MLKRWQVLSRCDAQQRHILWHCLPIECGTACGRALCITAVPMMLHAMLTGMVRMRHAAVL